jgi:hypothetical protein
MASESVGFLPWDWRKADGGFHLETDRTSGERLFHAYDVNDNAACEPNCGLSVTGEEFVDGVSPQCPACLEVVQDKPNGNRKRVYARNVGVRETPDEKIARLIAHIRERANAGHDYNSSAEAVRDTAIEAFNLMGDLLGITGFQAGWAALEAYAKVQQIDGPLIMLKGEDLLYPQYDIPAKVATWIAEQEEWLEEQATQKLVNAGEDVHPAVRRHWEDLARVRK